MPVNDSLADGYLASVAVLQADALAGRERHTTGRRRGAAAAGPAPVGSRRLVAPAIATALRRQRKAAEQACRRSTL